MIFAKFKKYILFFGTLFLLLFGAVFASEKVYHIERFDAVYRVNQDSTVDVTEKLTFSFVGPFHNVWRDISLQNMSYISDARVLDENGEPLDFNVEKKQGLLRIKARFNKDDAHGFLQDGKLEEWKKTFVFKYKMHGAISFLKNYDELYVNVFTSWPVPIRRASAKVIVPGAEIVQSRAYTSPYQKMRLFKGKHSIMYESNKSFESRAKFSVAVGFEKGWVSEAAFWREWLLANAFWFIAIFAFLVSVLYSLLFWIYNEFLPKRRGVIVPQYEPPLRMSPEEIYILWKERVNLKKILPAVIVNMAVKGLLTIKEDIPDSILKSLLRRMPKNNQFYVVATILIIVSVILFVNIPLRNFLPIFLFIFVFLGLIYLLSEPLVKRDYLIIINPDKSASLSSTERHVIDFLMSFGKLKENVFSTYQMRKQVMESRSKALSAYVKRFYLADHILHKVYNKFKQYYEVPLPVKYNTKHLQNEPLSHQQNIQNAQEKWGNYNVALIFFMSFFPVILILLYELRVFIGEKRVMNIYAALVVFFIVAIFIISSKNNPNMFKIKKPRKSYTRILDILKKPQFLIIAILYLVSALYNLYVVGINTGILIASAIFLISWLIIYAVKNNPRFNKKGNELYHQILGFKMYLETAERYRLQNLTPETFEKFLPYAMIFGIEKKWAEAFEKLGIAVHQPKWYSGHAGLASGSSFSGAQGSVASSFSASAFSASFASSFSSAMSSSGAGGGASGGGGSAGGGAGGGGGGAS